MKKIFYTLGSIVLIVYIAYQGAALLIPLTLSIFFRLRMSGQANYLQKKIKPEISRYIVIAGYCLLAGLLIAGAAWSADFIQNNIQSFVTTIESGYASAQSWLQQYPWINKKVNGSITQLMDTQLDIGMFTGLASSTLSVITQGILVAIVSILLLIKEKSIIGIIDKHFPDQDNVILQARDIVTNYMKGLFVLVVIVFLLYSIGLGIIGVPYLIIIAGVSALLCLVPTIGTFIGGVGATILSGLATGSLRTALLVAAWYTLVQVIEEYFILPQIVGQKVNINVIVSITAVISGGLIRGIAGLFLAIPIVGIIQKTMTEKHPLANDLIQPLNK